MSNLLLIMANISMFVNNLLFLKELEKMEGDPESSIIPAHLPARPEGKGMLGRLATGEAHIHSLHGLSCRPRWGWGNPHRSQTIPDYTNDESHHLQSFLVSYEKEAGTM